MQVIENLKATYPEVFIKEKWDDEQMSNKYPVIHYVCNPIFIDRNRKSYYDPISSLSSNVEKAYKTSMTEIARHASSGGSGSRRRILWRRWRPEAAVAGMSGR